MEEIEKNLNIPTAGLEDEAVVIRQQRNELKLPLALILGALLLYVAHAFLKRGESGFIAMLLTDGKRLGLEVAGGVVACFLLSFLLDISFGNVGPAILKWTAIILFPGACCLFFAPSIAIVIALPMYLYFTGKLFELEAIDIFWTNLVLVLVCRIIIHLQDFLATLMEWFPI